MKKKERKRYIEGDFHNYYVEAEYNLEGPYNYYDGQGSISRDMYDVQDIEIVRILDVDDNEITDLNDRTMEKIKQHIEDKILCDC